MKKNTREWLDAAADDLKAIDSLLDNTDLTNIVAFHVQQAVEKAFKAVIEENKLKLIKTHNLQTLFFQIFSFLPDVIDEKILAELDRLYIDARYPGNMGLMPYGKPSMDEARIYYEEAKNIWHKIKDSLE